jgi:hypothetical protein
MDARRFDSLVRTVSAATTRRSALAALVTSLIAPLFPGVADARRGKGEGKGKASQTSGKGHKGHGGHHMHSKRRDKRKHKRDDKRDSRSDHPAPDEAARAKACRQVGHPCEGNQVCCAGLICVASGPGAAVRCTLCGGAGEHCCADDGCEDGLLCQADGKCACEGDSCGRCRACENSECVFDASFVCTPLDQCHEAGACDPERFECTNPRKPENAPCDDGDPCTQDDVCQNGVCSSGPSKDCSSEADACNDGVCRQGGICGKRPKQDGTSCNADNDSCTSGDSCQNGVCVPGAGVDCRSEDDQCNRGVCRQSDGACVKEPRPDGTSCGANGECVSGGCEEIVCLALREPCQDDSQCCQQGEVTHCAVSFDFNDTNCCRPSGGACEETSDCCDSNACINGFCCTPFGETCPSSGECCPGSVCDDSLGPVSICNCAQHGFYCDGIDNSLTVCCEGEGTCEFWAPEPGRKRCCDPDGTPCDSSFTFSHFGCCGGYCSTASGTCSSTCTPIGGECRHHNECCGVIQDCLIEPGAGIGRCVDR